LNLAKKEVNTSNQHSYTTNGTTFLGTYKMAEDTNFEKNSAQALQAFSITGVKQIAPGKLQYKPQILAKYAQLPTIKIENKPPAPLYSVTNNKPKPKINYWTVRVKTSLTHQSRKLITLNPQPTATSQHQRTRKRHHHQNRLPAPMTQ
jgi:hypothetical protein